MTNFKTTTLIAALAIAAPAVAMAQAMADIDVNGDGVLTIDEMQAVFDDVSTDGFSAMDLNADGVGCGRGPSGPRSRPDARRLRQ